MKQYLYLILCIMLATSLQAQEARHAFVNMPDSILPTLTKINRADCIDFLDSHMRALVKNRFDQESEMTRLTKDYIAMQLSPMQQFEMKLLPTSEPPTSSAPYKRYAATHVTAASISIRPPGSL